MSQPLNKTMRRLFYITLNKSPVPRCDELQKLHGKPFVKITIYANNSLPEWFCCLVTYTGVEYKDGMIIKTNGSKLSATKWLSNIGVSEQKISQVGHAIAQQNLTLTLSCSFKDLIRAADGDNWRTCWHNRDIEELLYKPNVAIAHHRTKHGSFNCRWIVFWVKSLNAIVCHPYVYPHKVLPETIKKLCDVKLYTTHLQHPEGFYAENILTQECSLQHLYDEFRCRAMYSIREVT